MITTKASYVSTTTLFVEHWEGVNEVFGVTPFSIPGFVLKFSAPILRSDLQALLADLTLARTAVSNVNFTLAEKRDDFNSARVVAVDLHGQLNGKVRGSLPNSKWERLSTPVSSAEAGADVVLKAVTAGLNLWKRINADNVLGAPLLLRDGVTAAAFEVVRNGVTQAANNVTNAEQDLKDAVEDRNDIEEKIYAVLKAYRQLIPQSFPEGHAKIESMPALTPPPGATPDAVTLAGTFNTGTSMVDYSWDDSTSASVTRYDVYIMAGDEFNLDNADLAATIARGEPRVFSTSQFLPNIGNKIVGKIYAVTDTGHTAGSNAVVVTRTA